MWYSEDPKFVSWGRGEALRSGDGGRMEKAGYGLEELRDWSNFRTRNGLIVGLVTHVACGTFVRRGWSVTTGSISEDLLYTMIILAEKRHSIMPELCTDAADID